MRVIHILTAIVALALAPVAAAAPVKHKAGVWTLAAESDNSCMARMALPGRTLMLLATAGNLAFGVEADKPLPRGKLGVLATEAYSFGFEAHFSEKGEFLYTMKDLSPRELAALRLARSLRITVEGVSAAEASVDGSGLDEVMDAAAACSKGEDGWWGKGAKVNLPKAAEAGVPAMHKDGIWRLAADGDACVASADIDGGQRLILIGVNSGRDLMLGAGSDKGFKRGRKGLLETEAFKLPFTPTFDGPKNGYLQLDKFLDSQTVFVLKRAKNIYISIDGKEVISAAVGETAFADVIADVQTCGAGEKGWWGEGAKPAS